MMDQFFRPEVNANPFGFDRMRREIDLMRTQRAPLITQTPPPGGIGL